MATPAERRKADRVERTSHVLHREYMLAPDKPEYVKDKLLEVSTEGLSFASSRHYPVGSLLDMRLLIYGWEKHKFTYYTSDTRRATDPLVLLAEVTHAKPQADHTWRVGTKFASIDEWHRDALKKYLEEASKSVES